MKNQSEDSAEATIASGGDSGGFGAENGVARARPKSIRLAETIAIRLRSSRLRGQRPEQFRRLRSAGFTTSRSKVCSSDSASTIRKAAGRFNASAKLDRRGNLRRRGAARLFRSLPGDALPALDSFRRGGSQMRIRTARDHRHNPRDAQLRALFDRPLHAVELEDGENQGDLGQAGCGDFFAQFEFDAVVCYRSDSSAAHGLRRWQYRTPVRRERAARGPDDPHARQPGRRDLRRLRRR